MIVRARLFAMWPRLAACMLAIGLTRCHGDLSAPRAAPLPPSGSEATDAGRSATPTLRVQLSPTQLHLPLPPADASRPERQFYAAAIRSVRHVYEDDVDDPSQLLALEQRLGRDSQLARTRLVWRDILAASLDRAHTLQTLGPTLRALKQAVANTWRDEMTHTYRDVDQASCRMAQGHMPKEASLGPAPLQDTIVTVEPLGAYPLRTLLRFCDDPKSLYDHE